MAEERMGIAAGGTLAVGEAYYAADDAGAVRRHVADQLVSEMRAHGIPAMVRSGGLMVLAERCYLDGLECAGAEEAGAKMLADIHREAMERNEARAACARLSRAGIEAIRKAG